MTDPDPVEPEPIADRLVWHGGDVEVAEADGVEGPAPELPAPPRLSPSTTL